jgi:molybdenum cofactor cytidylyltransferase
VHPWATPNNRYRTDVDTLEDIEALAAGTGYRLKWPTDLAVTA